jgi:hypothetical protein
VNELLGEKSEPRWISMDKWEAEDYGGGNMHWSNYPSFYRGRNYTLFAKLAGVRSWHGDSAICPPRGIPDDASDAYIYITKQWEGDGHSHSYFTLKELLDEDWSEFENFQETLKEMSKLDDNPENIRAVFFFDN